jgi:hypothetical protein
MTLVPDKTSGLSLAHSVPPESLAASTFLSAARSPPEGSTAMAGPLGGKFVGRERRVYALEEYDFRKSQDEFMTELGGPANCIICGPKRSGKSSFLDAGWCLCMPERPMVFWMGGGGFKAAERRVLPCFVHEWGVDHTGDVVKDIDDGNAYQYVLKLWNVQKSAVVDMLKRKIDPRTVPEAFVDCVWDDCGQDPTWARSRLFKSMQLAGRHNQVGQTHSFHLITMINHESRENIDRLVVFEPNDDRQLQAIYEYQVSGYFEGKSDTPFDDWIDMARQYIVNKGAVVFRKTEGKALSNIQSVSPSRYGKVETRPAYYTGCPDTHWYCQWKCLRDRLNEGRKSGAYEKEGGSDLKEQFEGESAFRTWRDSGSFMTPDRAHQMELALWMRKGRQLPLAQLWGTHYSARATEVDQQLRSTFAHVSLHDPLAARLTPLARFAVMDSTPLAVMMSAAVPAIAESSPLAWMASAASQRIFVPISRLQSLFPGLFPTPPGLAAAPLSLAPITAASTLARVPTPAPAHPVHSPAPGFLAGSTGVTTGTATPSFVMAPHAHPTALSPAPFSVPVHVPVPVSVPFPVSVSAPRTFRSDDARVPAHAYADPRLPSSSRFSGDSTPSPHPVVSSSSSPSSPPSTAVHGYGSAPGGAPFPAPPTALRRPTSADPSPSRHGMRGPTPPADSPAPVDRLRFKMQQMREIRSRALHDARAIRYPTTKNWGEVEKIDDVLVYQDRSLDVGDEDYIAPRGSGRPSPAEAADLHDRMRSDFSAPLDRRMRPGATAASPARSS